MNAVTLNPNFCDYIDVYAASNNNNQTPAAAAAPATAAAADAVFGAPISVVVRREAGQVWGIVLEFPRLSVADLGRVTAEERIAAMELVKRGDATVNEALHRIKGKGRQTGPTGSAARQAIPIAHVYWNSAAAKSGVCEGDLITAVDGDKSAGQSVEKVMGKLMANNATQVVLTVLPRVHHRPALAAAATPTPGTPGADLYAGGPASSDVQVTRKAAKKHVGQARGASTWGLGVLVGVGGHLIIRVEPNGNAHTAGLRSGDRILAINGTVSSATSGVAPLAAQMKASGCSMAVRVVPREQWVHEVHEAGTAA